LVGQRLVQVWVDERGVGLGGGVNMEAQRSVGGEQIDDRALASAAVGVVCADDVGELVAGAVEHAVDGRCPFLYASREPSVQLLTAGPTAYTPPGDVTRSVAGPKPEVVSDAELLDRFWRGGEADAQAFVQRLQTRVYRLAVHILQDRGVAEDFAQEPFVRVWQKGGTYDPARASVGAWLLRITRNLAIDEFRRRTPDVLDPHRLDIPGSLSAEDDPDSRQGRPEPQPGRASTRLLRRLHLPGLPALYLSQ
jgi:DNA-directed RNA polymerase specialized sigma24 family protein